MALSLRFLAILSAVALISAAGRAQDPEVPVVGETIDVRVVNVEAVVTDEKGERVRGLTRADFRLLVDGQEVAVDYFTEVADGERPQGGGEAEVGRSYLVFLDDSFAVAEQRDSVLDALEKGLARLGPADRMAVLAFDGHRIDVLSPWTSDAAVLAGALRAARQRETRGGQLLAQHRGMAGDLDLAIEGAEALGFEEQDLAFIRSLFQNRISPEARTQVGRTAPAIASALRAFETPPGRKVMFLVSGGWSLAVAPQLFGAVIDAANRLGYTLYPVDAANATPQTLRAFDALAARTGGKAVASGLRLDAFQRVVADSGSYYWLGFTPSWKGDDQQHAVTVEVRRPGWKVRSRNGFSDLSRRSETALRAESLLLFGGGDQAREERKLIVQLGPARRAGRHQVELPVTLGVPVEALALTPSGKGYMAETPLAIAAVDSQGGRSDLPGSRLRIALQEVPRGGGYARFQTVIELRRAPQRLVFTVRDEVNGTVLWGEAHYTP